MFNSLNNKAQTQQLWVRSPPPPWCQISYACVQTWELSYLHHEQRPLYFGEWF